MDEVRKSPELPETERAVEEVLSLPVWPALEASPRRRVVGALGASPA